MDNSKTRREVVEGVLEYIGKYLDDAGWKICELSFFRVDPLAKSYHSSDTAFIIQLARDLHISRVEDWNYSSYDDAACHGDELAILERLRFLK